MLAILTAFTVFTFVDPLERNVLCFLSALYTRP